MDLLIAISLAYWYLYGKETCLGRRWTVERGSDCGRVGCLFISTKTENRVRGDAMNATGGPSRATQTIPTESSGNLGKKRKEQNDLKKEERQASTGNRLTRV